ncbi:MAG TPA: DUF418 domain-containing protein, partial [Anaerolineales bacterium]|nr:DUF418 domain-containing protein [Anaerolineales bacterium]
QVVDVLRGFAVLGILLMNMRGFSGQGFDGSNLVEPLDRAIFNLIDFLAQAKFYSLFSFLFGWGMAMQMARADAKNVKFIPLYLRRLLILFIFGGLHAIFLWTGDILTMYALLGMVLLLVFSRRSEKVLLIAFGTSLIFAIVMTLPGETMNAVRVWCRSTVECLRPDNPLPQSLYITGTYAEVTQLRFQGYLGGFWWVPCYFGNVLAMMLLGFYVGKRKIIENVEQHLPLIKKTLWIGLIVGLPLNALFVYSTLNPFDTQYASLIRVGARTLGAPALTLFYIAAILLYFQKESGRQRLASLAYVGRMALSNYIAHSVIGTFVFYGYGLGLYNETDPTFGLILTIGIYLAQIRISQWWFEHYQYGPLEWLWRTLSYAAQQPFSTMSSYDSLKNLSPQARRQRNFQLTAVAFLVIGGMFVFLNGLIDPDEQAVATEAATTEIASGGKSQSGEAMVPDEPTPFETPVVKPVNIAPGPIAASGDLQALAETFSAESAIEHIEVLAGQRFQGRLAGSPQGHTAGEYVAEQFDRFGLQPVGDEGTFFQTFAMPDLQIEKTLSLDLIRANGSIQGSYKPYVDFKPVLGNYAGAGIGTGEVVWVVGCEPLDFHELNVVGKIVFCRSENTQQAARLAVENGAAGLLLLTDPERQVPGYRNVPLPAWIPQPIPVFQVYPRVANDLLAGSDYSIADLSIIFEPVKLKSQVAMEVSTVPQCGGETCLGRNVLGVMRGKDPAYADQVIIVSANYDGPGKSPQGTAWLGANGNASGVAVLLEIARSWQEQAYVPSATVLFAAWDAGEQESLGAENYVQNPNYPLEKTLAVIQLDGLGAGGEILHIDGFGLAEKIEAAAQSFGVESSVTDELTGDHRLFAEAGVPAHALTWSGAENFSHLPTDTADNIQLERLERAGQIADLVILGISEGSPTIDDLLARRCSAIVNGDLNAFLDTSTLGQRQNDEVWFADVGQLKPLGCEMTPVNLTVAGTTAHSVVEVQLDVPTDDETETIIIDTQILFQHGSNGWKWDGSDLVTMETVSEEQTSFTVHQSPDSDDGEIAELGQLAVEEYARIADLLSLSSNTDAHIYMYPDRDELWSTTAPSRADQPDEWAGPDVLKLAFDPLDDDAARLQSSLTKLLLANAGIPDTSFAWLWEGLPLVVEGNNDPVALQTRLLSRLQAKLLSGDFGSSPESSWAAVEYLRQRVGWAGLGNFVTSLGRACQRFDCKTEAGADQALSAALRLDQDAFDRAWQVHWRTRLDSAQDALNAVLAQRAEAVLSGNEALFLETADRNVANLLAEEKDWFADLSQFLPDTFLLTGRPLVLLDNGDILASVRMEYELKDVSAVWGRGDLPMTILFTSRSGEYFWAGPLTESVIGNRIRVRYPAGQEELAEALLADAEIFYAQLANEVDVSNPSRLTVVLYDDRNTYRSSVSLSFPAPEWMPGWSAPGHSIKLLLTDSESAEDYHSALVAHLSRQLLMQKGVRDGWLLAGAGSYLSRNVAGGVSQKNAASSLASLARAVKNETEFDLTNYPPLYRLSQDDYRVALPQAWDSVRYLAETYGEDNLMALLSSQRTASDLEAALKAATRLSTSEFAAAWKDSFTLGHFPAASLERSRAFDVERALQHIDFLTSSGLAGRQAGSTGGAAAAEYIAQQFADSGLVVEQQYFPISYQTHLATPVMKLMLNNETVPFVYREDFLILQNVETNGKLSGELI